MMTLIRIACAALCFFFFSTHSLALAATEQKMTSSPQMPDSDYTLTVIPFYSPEKIWALYTPFIDFLRQTTGKPWTLTLFPTHKALIEALCRSQVAFALLGPVPLGRVMAQCNAEPVVVSLSNDGTPWYRSVIVTTDPAVQSITDLGDKRFGFFKGSTAAHILPRKILRQSGMNNAIIPVFFDGQDHIVNALLRRQVSASGIKENLYHRFKVDGFRVLTMSDPVPNFAFAASPQVSDETKKLFADSLFRLAPSSNESDQTLMAAWDDEIRYGFIPPTDTFRSSVKELLSLTDVIMREDR